jgi:hypothetical protein
LDLRGKSYRVGGWRRLHNEELHDLYCSENVMWVIKSRRVGCVGHVERMGWRGGTYRVLVGKHDRLKPLGIIRRRWKHDIKINLKEILYYEIILIKFNSLKHSTLEDSFSAVGIGYSVPVRHSTLEGSFSANDISYCVPIKHSTLEGSFSAVSICYSLPIKHSTLEGSFSALAICYSVPVKHTSL